MIGFPRVLHIIAKRGIKDIDLFIEYKNDLKESLSRWLSTWETDSVLANKLKGTRSRRFVGVKEDETRGQMSEVLFVLEIQRQGAQLGGYLWCIQVKIQLGADGTLWVTDQAKLEANAADIESVRKAIFSFHKIYVCIDIDGLGSGVVNNTSQQNEGELWDFILADRTRRKLPVVVASAETTQALDDARILAGDLAGMAHVYTVSGTRFWRRSTNLGITRTHTHSRLNASLLA